MKVGKCSFGTVEMTPQTRCILTYRNDMTFFLQVFFGDIENSYLTVLRQADRTLFLNSELLIRLDVLIDETLSEVTVWEQPAPVKQAQ